MPRYYINPGVIYLKGDSTMEAYANYCNDRWHRDVLSRDEACNFFNSHPKAREIKKFDTNKQLCYYTVGWNN